MLTEEEKYAETIISICSDFLSKSIDKNHFLNMIDVVNEKLQYIDNKDVSTEFNDYQDDYM